MSALGSSVISKSGKRFAPKKAPVRRPAQDSTSASARPSVERQTQSQTPQPQSAVTLVASSPAPSLTLSKPGATQQQLREAQDTPSQVDSASRIPIPSQSTPASRQPSPSSLISRKRPLDTVPYSVSLTPSGLPAAVQRTPSSVPRQDHHNKAAGSEPRITPQRGGISESLQDAVSCELPNPQEITTQRNARSSEIRIRTPKRHKIRDSYPGEASEEGEQAATGPNVPIPTTEVEDVSARAERAQTLDTTQSGPGTTRPTRRVKRGAKDPERSIGEEHQNAQATTLSSQEVGKTQETQTQPRGGREKTRKPKGRDRQQVIEDSAAEIVREAVQGSTREPTKRRRKSRRSPTPEDAEDARIAPSETRMVELCHDTGLGRKSTREQELREMDRAAFVKRKQRELQEKMGQAESPNEVGSNEPSAAREDRQERQQEREQAVTLNVPNTIIVNGQIQIDEDSLQIDRHAAAARQRDVEELEPIDENDLSRKITSGTWLKRDWSGGWNDVLLDRFYQGLRMFGTDFELISKMFPGKTRHAIKLKFCKEEKLDYPRIKAALLGEKVPVVLEEYERMTGAEYEDPKELERIMEEDRKKLEEEQAAEKKAMEDALREREAQAAAERAAASEESGKEGGGKGRNKKKTRKGKGKQRQPRVKKKTLGAGEAVMLQGIGERPLAATASASA